MRQECPYHDRKQLKPKQVTGYMGAITIQENHLCWFDVMRARGMTSVRQTAGLAQAENCPGLQACRKLKDDEKAKYEGPNHNP